MKCHPWGRMAPIVFSILMLAAMLLLNHSVRAQKRLIEKYESVVQEAKAELDVMMNEGGALQMEAVKRNIHGEFVLDVTVFEKGKIQSLFIVSNNGGDLNMQNRAKDLIRTLEFNFKVPKGKNYKFQYSFDFK